ncbi:D-amino acid dehydrogenase [Cereibacter sphaeroides]|uniref:D-amino acid dehydrogenase n=1 Tax=Cereibacter sphaeroides TaxID=1063 RepID=UPI001F410095|nr:D-amino acid dehydrogenase [Cereibacter sphaeroides]MCE6951449.1 D-amino acid dehydrogenase [Cereibacter sphaeroides]MCE6960774.1 D-amino acid dehydrogenase [Cereibacter sphaeroides]MCE6969960.1 D-amino acid dehydrogenase [Cereibacter sphaeroides]MCE6974348.1 D-amino acid dehydrogenase [Cereibacter sphaeroides]
MKVVILGAGVIGVTSAWQLARAGHEVTVIDRQPGPALETSFANAGEISPGYSSPWAAPGIPMKALKWLFMAHAPLVIQPRPDPEKIRWLLRMLGNCTADAYAVNKSRMVRLAEYSRDCLTDLRAETGLAFDERQKGTLQLFRTQKQVDAAAKDIEVLRAGGVPFELLDAEGCLAAEPGLAAAQDHIAGGLRLPKDETGDCFKFTQGLAALAATRGVRFRYGIGVERIVAAGGRVTSVVTSQGEVAADAVVVALGSYSPALVRPLGLDLPVYPFKGYSITLPIVDEARAPVSTVMDESYKVAITRLGDRIRVGGMAEIAGFDLSLNPKRKATLLRSVEDLFAGAGDRARATFWTGLRPMTPDGTPVIGRTPIEGLFLNTGHGTLGWTMAAGSARVLADLVSNRAPEIETSDLGLARYGVHRPTRRVGPRRRPAAEPAA